MTTHSTGAEMPAAPAWKFNELHADTEVRSAADDRLLAVIQAGPDRARIVGLLKGAASGDASASQQPAPAAEAMLYEHEDGRYAVWPGTESPPWTHGEPKWHRVGPVDVSGVATANGQDGLREPIERFRPEVVIDESNGRLKANGAAMLADPNGKWVRLSDHAAALAAAPAPVEQPATSMKDAERMVDELAVDRFAAAMKRKLAAARKKGRGGWQRCSTFDLSCMLREHIGKGDPTDVANFAMFLWNLDSAIVAPEPSPVEQPAPAGLSQQLRALGNAQHGTTRAQLLLAADRVDELARVTSPAEPPAQQPEGLQEAAQDMLDWCVKNVNRWNFPQYDRLSAALAATPVREAALRASRPLPADGQTELLPLPAIQQIIDIVARIKRGAEHWEGGWSGTAPCCEDVILRLQLVSSMWKRRNADYENVVAQCSRLASQGQEALHAAPAPDFDICTSAGGRGYVAWFFENRLRPNGRHDFRRYINERLAVDFACALAAHLSAPHPAPAADSAAREAVVAEKFQRAWLGLKELPGGMMVGPNGLFGPIPSSTSTWVTTSERERDRMQAGGTDVVEVWLARPAAPAAVPEPANSMGVPLSCGKPLCAPGRHHQLCAQAAPHAAAVPADRAAIDYLGNELARKHALYLSRGSVETLVAGVLAAQPSAGAPAAPHALTDAEIHAWWARDNGLEDLDLCKLDDFRAAVRIFEKRVGAASPAREGEQVGDARWQYVAQFLQLDDVGDDQFVLGLVVRNEALEEAVTPHVMRLERERNERQWRHPGEQPPVTLEQAIDAARAAVKKEG